MPKRNGSRPSVSFYRAGPKFEVLTAQAVETREHAVVIGLKVLDGCRQENDVPVGFYSALCWL